MIAPVLTTAKVILPAQYQTKYFWFIRLMGTFIVEKMDMNPQKGIDEDFRFTEGETCPRVFCTTDSVL